MSVFRSCNRTPATSACDDPPPASLSEDLTDRYASLNERQAIAELHQFSQVELTAIHAFERSHRDREPVVDKLRYLRQREPLPDYDVLETETVVATLSWADAGTIKTVREYEGKHQNRSAVNTAALEAMRSLRARPAGADGPAAPIPGSAVVRGNGLPLKMPPETGLGMP